MNLLNKFEPFFFSTDYIRENSNLQVYMNRDTPINIDIPVSFTVNINLLFPVVSLGNYGGLLLGAIGNISLVQEFLAELNNLTLQGNDLNTALGLIRVNSNITPEILHELLTLNPNITDTVVNSLYVIIDGEIIHGNRDSSHLYYIYDLLNELLSRHEAAYNSLINLRNLDINHNFMDTYLSNII
jgi:hypothetical protein